MVAEYLENAVSGASGNIIPQNQPLTTFSDSIALNYKGIPYRTEWVEAPDIQASLESLGVEPNPPSAYAPYTLPAIYDPRTRTSVMDSAKIAAYLDKTYPDTPAILPPATRVLQFAFLDAMYSAVEQPLSKTTIHPCNEKLNPPSRAYWREKLEGIFGCRLEDLSPPGSEQRTQQWAAAEKGLSTVASWFDAAGDDRLLLLGGGADGRDSPICYADTVIAAVLIHTRFALGEQSEEWRRIEGLDNGRWKRYLDYFEKWADVSH